MSNDFRDTIIMALEMSRRSKVPVLYMSNPGFGKTTTILEYALINGYHVESVIGSQYAKDEILGYQVNEGGESLTSKEPEWYSNIMKYHEKGTPSILFLDEISAASTEVQGSLLQVCFERKIRGNKSLPDDTIVCAAANYKLNLPGWCDIMAPSLNRFCIVNLQPKDDVSLIEEFTQNYTECSDDWPEFKTLDTSKIEQKILNLTRSLFTGLFKKYPKSLDSSTGSSMGALNLKNQCFDGMYSENDYGDEKVLNFISGRTISYLSRIIRTLSSMGITGDSHPEFVQIVTDGLVGLGTNSWSDDPEERMKQIDKYRTLVGQKVGEILNKCSGKEEGAREKKQSIIYNSDLQGKIIETINSYESGDFDDISQNLGEVTADICKKYTLDVPKSLAFLDGSDKKIGEFTSDFEAILRLEEFLKENYEGDADTSIVVSKLDVILKTYSILYQSAFIQ
ncbi:MAG: AAA family ATPase [Clostridia bacterium]|nr:AAA family ATPase [Clostridia bacterium]